MWGTWFEPPSDRKGDQGPKQREGRRGKVQLHSRGCESREDGENFTACPWVSQRGIWAGPRTKRQPIPVAGPTPVLGILAGRFGCRKLLFALLCLLTVYPVPRISSGKLRNPFSVPDSFPSRKQALHPVAFKWIFFNVSL